MVLVSRSYIHTRLHGKRAVERYTADTHPTTGLQSYTAYTALYSVVYYTAIQLRADGEADTATAQDVEIIVDNYINLAHTMNFYQKRD